MSFIPAVPYRCLIPIAGPGQYERIEAASFEDFHPIVFYNYLRIIDARPFSQESFGITVAHDHYVQGLGGPICGYGHLV